MYKLKKSILVIITLLLVTTLSYPLVYADTEPSGVSYDCTWQGGDDCPAGGEGGCRCIPVVAKPPQN
jgi:hypothetical protein